jgi:integrase/recombinase XerD
MLLSSVEEGFIRTKLSDGFSPTTARTYLSNFRQMHACMGDPHIETITANDLRSFLYWLRTDYIPNNNYKRHISNKTLNNYWSFLRSLFGFLVSQNLIVENVALGLKEPEFESPEIRPFSEADVRAFLLHAKRVKTVEGRSWVRVMARRDEAIILVLLDTGMRIGELCRLTIGDVNLNSGEIYIKPFRTRRKTKSRTLHIANSATRSLWRYLVGRNDANTDEFVFLSENNQPLTRQSIYKNFEDIGRRAGVKPANPHRFRHTFAIQFLRNGGNPFTLQRILGHSTFDMVKRYLAIVQADIAANHQTASPVDRWHL